MTRIALVTESPSLRRGRSGKNMPPLIFSEDEKSETEIPPKSNVFYDAASDVSEPNVEDGDGVEELNAKDFTPVARSKLHSHHRSASRSNSLHSSEGQFESDEEGELLDDDFGSEPGDETADLSARPQESRRLDSIRPPDFIYPLSTYEGHIPPLLQSTEKTIVDDFTREISSAKATYDNEDFIEFDLNDFSIYLPGSDKVHPWTMSGLQNLATKHVNSWYCFDGILGVGEQRRYVQCVPFKLCSIGNYGLEFDSVGDHIWIQSELNKHSDIYYRLKTPSSEYERYHDGFVWLANLAKHFVDFLKIGLERDEMVSIHNFRADFCRWLEKTHGKSPAYQHWYRRYNRHDFRGHVSANIDFLWKEATGTYGPLLKHPVWNQVKWMDFIPKQKLRETGTVVTPYVYECFNHLKFGPHLVSVTPKSNVRIQRSSLGHKRRLTTAAVGAVAHRPLNNCKLDKESIAIGDVLGVTKDDEGSSQWKDEPSRWKAADECWYAYVQRIHVDGKGSRSFDVIWLYKPSDTTCAKMKYLYNDELFLSDNCSCSRHRITEGEVLSKISVAWNGLPGAPGSDCFIRQTYLHNNAFVTLKESHKRCVHLRDELKTPLQDLVETCQVGDTVLFKPPSHLKSRHGLEPGEIVALKQEGKDGFVTMRRLIRRRDLDGAMARPNELVYTDEIFAVAAGHVGRKCFVRFYTRSEVEDRAVPTPYDRDGTADAFYITTRLVGNDNETGTTARLQPIHDHLPRSLIQGFDPNGSPLRRRLRGLDLYCGGGNFGRGLEEGGAIHNTHAVDLNANAIHTYYANLDNPKSTKIYYGSVDDLLAQAIRGNPSKSDLVPLPGDIDFISAGSPCPGFSLLNSRRGNEKGLRNQSLVASVAAYIDVYRPKYALLENVITMAQKGKGRDEDVLSQLICCLVGMGYQVQVFNLDAWSFGSPQTRSRLFVSVAAPGLEPPAHPSLSHSHPRHTTERGLGKMSNGLAFGQRRFEPTPFKYVNAEEATEDLPDIGDSRTYQCIQHPDHRIARGICRLMKAQIEMIPIKPREMNFWKTLQSGLMTKAERDLFPTMTKKGTPCRSTSPGSQAWGRLHPQKLFPTIATSASPACAITGRTLHWDQQRPTTILEIRRAQGFPDDEVITGTRDMQWRIIGNSVARTVSLVLGLSLREAWLKSSSDETGDAIGMAIVSAKTSSGMPKASDPVSSDDAAVSDQHYRRSLDIIGLRSSVSRDEFSSTTLSEAFSDQNSSNGKRRRHNISEVVSKHGPGKSRRLLGPASARDSVTLWSHSNQPSTTSTPEMGDALSGSSSSTFEPAALTKKLRTLQEESETSAKHPRPKPSRPSKAGPCTHRKSLDGRRMAQVKIHQNPPTPSERPGPKQVINLTSDGEDAEDEDEDEDLVFLSSAQTKPMYVPADNSMFSAYEQTNGVVRLEAMRR